MKRMLTSLKVCGPLLREKSCLNEGEGKSGSEGEEEEEGRGKRRRAGKKLSFWPFGYLNSVALQSRSRKALLLLLLLLLH